MKSFNLAIVGATGLVGRSVLKVLEEKNLPIKNCSLFATEKSVGKSIRFKGKNLLVQKLDESSFLSHFDFAIFAAGGEISKIYAPIAAESGCIVIDNSSYFRMNDDVPLVVPEVNFSDALNHKGIIANPNCSTIQAMLPLKVLDDKYVIKRVVYSTYQAVSGAGKKALLDLNVKDNSSSLNVFPYQIYDNCLPHIDSFLDNGYTKEELKMINETRKILHHPNLKVTATTVRVPVSNSHSESINVEFEKDFDLDDLKKSLSNFKNIVLMDDIKNNIYPMAITANGHDEVFVGRVRRDYSVDFGINMWVVADNIRKGAATNAVQIMEYLINYNEEVSYGKN